MMRPRANPVAPSSVAKTGRKGTTNPMPTVEMKREPRRMATGNLGATREVAVQVTTGASAGDFGSVILSLGSTFIHHNSRSTRKRTVHWRPGLSRAVPLLSLSQPSHLAQSQRSILCGFQASLIAVLRSTRCASSKGTDGSSIHCTTFVPTWG